MSARVILLASPKQASPARTEISRASLASLPTRAAPGFFSQAKSLPYSKPRTPAIFLASLYLLMLGPPVLALRFGVAAVHRRKGLST